MVVRTEGGQTGVVGSHGLGAGLGVTAQPQEGGGHGQFDGAGLRATLLLGQAAAQLVGAPRLVESLFMTGLTVEAACQTEPKGEGESVRKGWSSERLPGKRLGLRPCPLSA